MYLSDNTEICSHNFKFDNQSILYQRKKWQVEKFSISNFLTFRGGFLKIYIFYEMVPVIHTYLAQTPEIGQDLGRFLSCGARKQEQT